MAMPQAARGPTSGFSPLLMGIDVGTSGVKVVLVEARGDDGHALAHATIEHPLSSPRPGWSEQEPEHWWRGVAAGVRQVLASGRVDAAQVAAIGLSGQMHGLVILDARGEALRPAILWNDQRTAAQCESITQRVGAGRVLELTGNPVLTGFTAPKIEWVREHEPEVFARVDGALLPKDYVRFRLTGERATDVTDASGTSLFDVRKRAWSEEILDAIDVPKRWMPTVTESHVVSGRLSREAASALGLLEGTPVVAGAGDQAAQAVGTGIVDEGTVCVTIGTSGVVFAPSAAYRVEPRGRLHAFCHAVADVWHLMGVMLAAGASFRWLRDVFHGESFNEYACHLGKDPYDLMTTDAAKIAAGSEGLIFLPYLCGERTPHPDPDARGAFVGLTTRHGRAHLSRAVLEGVTFGLRDSLEVMREMRLPIRDVRVSGGGARGALWRQILADVLNVEVSTVGAIHGAALGAAVLAGVGAGRWPSTAEASRRVAGRIDSRTAPGPDAAAYAEYYARYRALYPALADEFHALSRLARE